MQAVLVGSLMKGFAVRAVEHDPEKAQSYAKAQIAGGQMAEVIELDDPATRDKMFERDYKGDIVVSVNWGMDEGSSFYGPFSFPEEAQTFVERNRSVGGDWRVMPSNIDRQVEVQKPDGDLKPFSVLSVDANTGDVYYDYVNADSADHAFVMAAANKEGDHDARYICALPGHVQEGSGIEFPSEALMQLEASLPDVQKTPSEAHRG